MSTKGTHHSRLARGAVCRDHAGAVAGKGPGSVSDRQLARDPAGVSRQDAAVQQRVRHQREDPGLSRPREARQVSRRLRAHQGRHAVPVGHRPRVLSPVRAGLQPRAVRRGDFHPRRRAVSRRSRTGAAARRREGRRRPTGRRSPSSDRARPDTAPRISSRASATRSRFSRSRRRPAGSIAAAFPTGCCRRTCSIARSSGSSSSASRSRPTPRSARTSPGTI